MNYAFFQPPPTNGLQLELPHTEIERKGGATIFRVVVLIR